jgi:hypothetical protein
MAFAAAPLYVIVALVATTVDQLGELKPLQTEGVLLCLLVFLGVQAAWVVAMAPKAAAEH